MEKIFLRPFGLMGLIGPQFHGSRPFDFAQGRLWAAFFRSFAAATAF
jgi:hypothetical protein